MTNLARILQDDTNLARFLQEICQVNAFTCKILQESLPESCKICLFPYQGSRLETAVIILSCWCALLILYTNPILFFILRSDYHIMPLVIRVMTSSQQQVWRNLSAIIILTYYDLLREFLLNKLE